MTNEQHEIIKALTLISNICTNHSCCSDCPFRDIEENCQLAIDFPSEWKLANDNTTWRAFAD